MNTNPVSKTGATLRGLIIVLASMLTYALGDATIRTWLPPHTLAVLGVAGAGLLTFRAWLDQSSSRVPLPGSVTTSTASTSTDSVTPPDAPPPADPATSPATADTTAPPSA